MSEMAPHDLHSCVLCTIQSSIPSTDNYILRTQSSHKTTRGAALYHLNRKPSKTEFSGYICGVCVYILTEVWLYTFFGPNSGLMLVY